MKGSEFLLKISSANMKKIANGFEIHFIKFTLVLAIRKNPLIRVFPIFATNFYRESTLVHRNDNRGFILALLSVYQK